MDANSNSEREFFRAPATLYVFYGSESLEARQAMALNADTWHRQDELEENARRVMEGKEVPENMRPLLNVLRWLDFKLDMILHHIRSHQREAAFPNHLQTIDVSGSGFGLADCGTLKQGERIIMAFSLPDSPNQPIYAVGEVVRASDETCSTQAKAGVRFVEISEHDRERVIRFAFNQQRRELAQRMRGEEA